MSEQMIQVPVSLVKELHTALGFHIGYDDSLTRRVDALLSQPTPTAEPVTLDQRAVQAFGPEVLERTGPPDIADMVPGTRFGIRVSVEYDGVDVVSIPNGDQRWNVSEIDPSTIRDVTPPKE